MKDAHTAAELIPKRFTASILLGILYILVFGAAGAICPVMAATLKDFGFECHWRHTVCSAICWQWTVPLSVILAAIVVWKVSIVTPRSNRILNSLAFAGVLLVAVAVFLLTTCFTIRGNTLTSPFGKTTIEGRL